ncbi:MAG: hypothetical protein LH679_02465 [Cyanobacteria bacterium CAN_BIN43]|nr:hypothetical protein [Cyanobacteria bacterium CAN_BIN43]
MTEQVTLIIPDSLAQQVREVAAQTQRPLEDVLLEWLRRGSIEPATPSRHLEAITPPTQTPASSKSRYPLRGLPLQMSEDFDAPMPELWEALGE